MPGETLKGIVIDPSSELAPKGQIDLASVGRRVEEINRLMDLKIKEADLEYYFPDGWSSRDSIQLLAALMSDEEVRTLNGEMTKYSWYAWRRLQEGSVGHRQEIASHISGMINRAMDERGLYKDCVKERWLSVCMFGIDREELMADLEALADVATFPDKEGEYYGAGVFALFLASSLTDEELRTISNYFAANPGWVNSSLNGQIMRDVFAFCLQERGKKEG